MGKTAETLRGDLRAVQSALGDVLRRVRPPVPSRCFPQRLAADLSLEGLLADDGDGDEGDDDRKVVLLLEMMVDRLQLLLQSTLKLWSEEEGRASKSVPLTLPSTVKKYCRKLLKSSSTTQHLLEQLTAKDVTISSLSSTVDQLREECQRLHSSSSSTNGTLVGQNRPASVLARSVPYEARGSLKLSRLLQSPQCMEPTTTPDILSPPPPSSVASPSSFSPTLDKGQPQQCTVSIQTNDTSFAPCMQCMDTQASLMSVAKSLSALSHQLKLPSQVTEKRWGSVVGRGEVEVRALERDVTADLGAIRDHCKALEVQVGQLQEQMYQQNLVENDLQLNLTQLKTEVESLNYNTAESERRHTEELGKSRQCMAGQLSQIEASHSRLAERSRRLEGELRSVRQEKEQMKALLSEINQQMSTLQSELKQSLSYQSSLLSSHTALQTDLKALRGQLEENRDVLETERLQLAKMTTLKHTLERKNKTILSKQSALLQRLEELDREAECLRSEVSESAQARAELTTQLEHVQVECATLQDRVREQQSRAEASAEEQLCLSVQIQTLESQLSSLSSQLESEKDNSKLLASHPFIHPESESYREYLALLSSSPKKSRKQISANTIRILLLEEENTDLREMTLPRATRGGSKRRGCVETTKPVPLWQPSLLSKAESVLKRRGSRSTSSPSSSFSSSTHTRPPPHAGRDTVCDIICSS